ncbi:MAG: hypothetical protein AABP62_28025 [Planctomycetota bacterium]
MQGNCGKDILSGGGGDDTLDGGDGTNVLGRRSGIGHPAGGRARI